MKFFSSYAIRQFAKINHVDYMYNTYEEALNHAYGQLCDDDDASVYCILEEHDMCIANGKHIYIAGFFEILEQLDNNTFLGLSVLYPNLYENKVILKKFDKHSQNNII